MAFTRDDVKALNHDIRTLRLQNGELGLSSLAVDQWEKERNAEPVRLPRRLQRLTWTQDNKPPPNAGSKADDKRSCEQSPDASTTMLQVKIGSTPERRRGGPEDDFEP